MLKKHWLLMRFGGSREQLAFQEDERFGENGQFLAEKAAQEKQKEKKRTSRHDMAGMMHTCSGLVGPKSENVEKPWVLKLFLKVSREV